MYIVTSRPISEIFNHPDEVGYFAFKSDAEIYAQKQAAETNEAQVIVLLTEESRFLPTATWAVTFEKSVVRTTEVRAKDVHESVKKARESFPEDEWALRYTVKKDQ